ncbi:DUF167 domain-containing protein [Eggerthellaceae bacterium zg-997]|nr:DUF167 domain-containing protein [Eggerthellaceae bacterium zg-997]
MSHPVKLHVHVTPRSGRDVVMGRVSAAAGQPELVRLRVRAVPDRGKANEAVCALIARQLGVAKSAVSVEGGFTARRKVVGIAADEQLVRQWMGELPLMGE